MSRRVDLFLPPLGGPNDTEVVAAKNIIASRDYEITKQKQNSLIRCMECDALCRVGEEEYIQTHFYIQPHGCSGGDYWLEGEGQWICSHCSKMNRLYDSNDVVALKWAFKSVIDIYKE